MTPWICKRFVGPFSPQSMLDDQASGLGRIQIKWKGIEAR